MHLLHFFAALLHAGKIIAKRRAMASIIIPFRIAKRGGSASSRRATRMGRRRSIALATSGRSRSARGMGEAGGAPSAAAIALIIFAISALTRACAFGASWWRRRSMR
ncbi:MAG: hypothetical protein ACO326_09010 [Burkholderiaceae bacterium]